MHLGPRRAGNARIAQCATHVQLVLRVEESGGARAYGNTHCLELLEIRGRNMLVVEGDHIKPTSEAQKVIEAIM